MLCSSSQASAVAAHHRVGLIEEFGVVHHVPVALVPPEVVAEIGGIGPFMEIIDRPSRSPIDIEVNVLA